MVDEIDVREHLDLDLGAVEQCDAGLRVVVSRRVEHTLERGLPIGVANCMNLTGDPLRVLVATAGQLLEIQSEVTRHDARRREVRQSGFDPLDFEIDEDARPSLGMIQLTDTVLTMRRRSTGAERLYMAGQDMPWFR